MPEDLPHRCGPSSPSAPPGLRASDADRDRVAAILRLAAGDGRLTADEFDERLDAALTSRTLGELAGLTADLGYDPGGLGDTPALAGEVMQIAQRGGSVRRTGRWMVPRRLQLRPSWCDVTLDFTDAVINNDTLHIDMNMRGGSLILLLRPGLVVEAGSLRLRYSDVDIRRGAGPGATVILQVQLTGRMRYGWIEMRWP